MPERPSSQSYTEFFEDDDRPADIPGQASILEPSDATILVCTSCGKPESGPGRCEDPGHAEFMPL